MKSYHYATMDELNGVIAQLSEAARRPESGRHVEPAEDGNGWIMFVADEFVEEVDAADPTIPEPDRRPIAKSLVMARLSAASKLDAAFAALMAKPDLFARWFAPDRGFVNSDDPDTIGFLQQLGVDPIAMLAPPTTSGA